MRNRTIGRSAMPCEAIQPHVAAANERGDDAGGKLHDAVGTEFIRRQESRRDRQDNKDGEAGADRATDGDERRQLAKKGPRVRRGRGR